MGIRDRVVASVTSWVSDVQRATGAALGDETLSAAQQRQELSRRARRMGESLRQVTGAALGDEDMSVDDQITAVAQRARNVWTHVKDSLKGE
jgi:hypothetical protein